MTRLKICGLRRKEDIEYANEVRPDYAGFILSKPFFRYVSPDELASLSGMLSPEIKKVGVFVNETPEYEADLIERGLIDIVQLHGDEENSHIDRLKEILSDHDEKAGSRTMVIKAVRVRDKKDVEDAFYSHADILLMDAYVKGSAGGNGISFNWDLLEEIDRDFILAGGLDEKNVADAIEKLHPFAVDASSSLETDRKKDLKKMRAFADAVKSVRC